MLLGEDLDQSLVELFVDGQILVIDCGQLLGNSSGQVSEQIDGIVHRVARDDLVAAGCGHEIRMVQCSPLPREQVVKLRRAVAFDLALGHA